MTSAALGKSQREALSEFVKRLYAAEGDNLLQVVLFGSMARGDGHSESDIDVFVLLRSEDGAVRAADRVSDIAFDINLQKSSGGVYISPLICSAGFYRENRKKDLIFYNIEDEGKVLYDARA